MDRNVKRKSLHVVCCFKIIEAIDTMTKSEYEQLVNGVEMIPYIKRVLNCFDEAVLENALCLKDECAKQNVDVKITAITINPGYSEYILKNFPAIGIDQTIVLQAEEWDLRFQPEITAGILSDYIKNHLTCHLLLMGKQAPPANSELVPLFLAEDLNMPCITDVTNLRLHEDGFWMERFTGNSTEKMLVRRPVIATIGNSNHSYIRVPTLKDKLKTKNWKPTVENVDISKLSVAKKFLLQSITDERVCREIKGVDVADKAKALRNLLSSGGDIL